MTTDKTFTLIHYRPNGKEYQGGGDYEHYNSEIGFEHGLNLEQLRHRIFHHTKQHRFDTDSDCEFAILMDGKPIASRGGSLWSFADAAEARSDGIQQELADLLTEARVLSQQEKADREQKKRDEEAASTKRYFAEQERKHYESAKKLITDYEARQKKGTP